MSPKSKKQKLELLLKDYPVLFNALKTRYFCLFVDVPSTAGSDIMKTEENKTRNEQAVPGSVTG